MDGGTMRYKDGFFTFETLLKGLISGIFFFYFQNSVVARDFDNYSKSRAKIEKELEWIERLNCSTNGAFMWVVPANIRSDFDKMYRDAERERPKNELSYNEWFVIYHWRTLMNDMHSKVPHLTQWQLESLDEYATDLRAGKLTQEKISEHHQSSTYRQSDVIEYLHVSLRIMKDIEYTKDIGERRLLWADLITYSDSHVESMLKNLFHLYTEKIISSDAVIMDDWDKFSRLAAAENYGEPLYFMENALDAMLWIVMACPNDGGEYSPSR